MIEVGGSNKRMIFAEYAWKIKKLGYEMDMPGCQE